MQEKVKPFSLNSALNRCEMYYFNRSIESNSNLFQTGSAASALCSLSIEFDFETGSRPRRRAWTLDNNKSR